jgi:hypothetical protein
MEMGPTCYASRVAGGREALELAGRPMADQVAGPATWDVWIRKTPIPLLTPS